MSGKKYKVARAYSLRMLSDETPGIYRRISDDSPAVRNPRANRPLSFAYGEKDISALRRYNGEREDIPVERNRNALTWSGESPFRAEVSNSLSELPQERSMSTGLNGESELLPFDLDKKGALDLQDSDKQEQITRKRQNSSSSSSSSNSETAGKRKRHSSSSSTSSNESKHVASEHPNGILSKSDIDKPCGFKEGNGAMLRRKSSSSSDGRGIKGNIIVDDVIVPIGQNLAVEVNTTAPGLNSVDRRQTVYEKPWDGANFTDENKNKNPDHDTSLSSIENQIMELHPKSDININKAIVPETNTENCRRDSTSSIESSNSSCSSEQYLTSSNSEAPPLPKTNPPDTIAKEISENVEIQILDEIPVETNLTVDGETQPASKRLSVTYYGPVYMHDNILILPTTSSQFSGGDNSYQSGMIFQGQIELEHVPQEQFNLDSNDSSNESNSNDGPEIANIKISFPDKAKWTNDGIEYESDDSIEPIPIISAEFVKPTESTRPKIKSRDDKIKSGSSSSSSSSSDSDSDTDIKNKSKKRPGKLSVSSDSDNERSNMVPLKHEEAVITVEEPKIEILNLLESKLPTEFSLTEQSPRTGEWDNEQSPRDDSTKSESSSSSSSSSDSDSDNGGKKLKKPKMHLNDTKIETSDWNLSQSIPSTAIEFTVTEQPPTDFEENNTLVVSKPEVNNYTEQELHFPPTNTCIGLPTAVASKPVHVVSTANIQKPELDITASCVEPALVDGLIEQELLTETPVLPEFKIVAPIITATNPEQKLRSVEIEQTKFQATVDYNELPDFVSKDLNSEKCLPSEVGVEQPSAVINKPTIERSKSTSSESSSSSSLSSSDSSDTDENPSVNAENVRVDGTLDIHEKPVPGVSFLPSQVGVEQPSAIVNEPTIECPKSTTSESSSSSSSDSSDTDDNHSVNDEKVRIDGKRDIYEKPLPGVSCLDRDKPDLSVLEQISQVPEISVNETGQAAHILFPSELKTSSPLDVTAVELPSDLKIPDTSTSKSLLDLSANLSVQDPHVSVELDVSCTPDITSNIKTNYNTTTSSSSSTDSDSDKEGGKSKDVVKQSSISSDLDEVNKLPPKQGEPTIHVVEDLTVETSLNAPNVSPEKSKPGINLDFKTNNMNPPIDAEVKLPTNYIPYIPDTLEDLKPPVNIECSEVCQEKSKNEDSPTNKKGQKNKDTQKRKPDFGLKIPEKITSLVHKLSFKSNPDKGHLKSTDDLTASGHTESEIVTAPTSQEKKNEKPDIKEPTKSSEKKSSKLKKQKKKRSKSSSSSDSSSSKTSDDEHKKHKSAMKNDKEVLDKEVQVNVFKVSLKSDQACKPNEFKQPRKKKIAKEPKTPPTSPESPFDKLSHIFHRTHKAKITDIKQDDKGKEKDKAMKDKKKKKPSSISSSDNRDRTASQTSGMSDDQVNKTGNCSSTTEEESKKITTEEKSPLKTLTEFTSLLEEKMAQSPEKQQSDEDKHTCQSDADNNKNDIKQNDVLFTDEIAEKGKLEKVEAKRKSSLSSESSIDEHRKRALKERIEKVKEIKRSSSSESSDNETKKASVEEKTHDKTKLKKRSSSSSSSSSKSSNESKKPFVQEKMQKIATVKKSLSSSSESSADELKKTNIEQKMHKVEKIKKSSKSSDDESKKGAIRGKVKTEKPSSSSSESSDDEKTKEKRKKKKLFSLVPRDDKAKGIVDNDIHITIDAKQPKASEIMFDDSWSPEIEIIDRPTLQKWNSPNSSKVKRSGSTSSSSSSSSKSSKEKSKNKYVDADIHQILEAEKRIPDNTEQSIIQEEIQKTETPVVNSEFPRVTNSVGKKITKPSSAPARDLSIDSTGALEVEKALQTLDNSIIAAEQPPRKHQGHFVVVAIDFGTAYSGYAFSFTRDPDSIHMMRKWEGGDPGIINQKAPTIMLLTPDGSFHSFGYSARDNYHDLDKERAQDWMYFEKFKMTLHTATDLTTDTQLIAANGRPFSALKIFTFALSYFRDHVIRELSDQSGTKILNEDIRWVVCVPAIWKAPAKQFMRQAAYKAGIASEEFPDQLLIALEPEAASIYCRKLRMHQLVPEVPRPLQSPSWKDPVNLDNAFEISNQGTRYMVVDCGGGTVDITVHELDSSGKLAELHKATGGPYGSIGVDIEFEKLMISIFGKTLIEQYKFKRSAGWVDLLIAFESRKRSATPYKTSPLNIALPFSFIDYYRKHKLTGIETAIKRHGDKDITWSSQGMLRLAPDAMKKLFMPTIQKIKEKIGSVLNNDITDLKYLFLVGGFAESAIVQNEIRQEFGNIIQVIIPQGVAMTILKGAVLFGLDPTIVNVRRCPLTYGVGVLNRFNPKKHPLLKKVSRQGIEWCTDIFDKYVVMDQPVTIGDVILRSYTPARVDQRLIQINIYCCENKEPKFITEPGVHKVGTVTLHLSGTSDDVMPKRREIQTRMQFGETEIRVSALDVSTGEHIQSTVDFLSR